MNVDSEKYKFLFEYQKNQFDEETNRFRRLEEKALKFVNLITFVLGAYLFLIRQIIKEVIPPTNLLEWLIIISILITFICFLSSWSLIFRAIKLSDFVKMPSNDDTILYFKKNAKETVYHGLSKKYSEAIKKVEENYSKKLDFVQKAYSDISGTIWMLSISIVLILIREWSK
jgi:succinate dehydrogenase hydrophobic anchor subunit